MLCYAVLCCVVLRCVTLCCVTCYVLCVVLLFLHEFILFFINCVMLKFCCFVGSHSFLCSCILSCFIYLFFLASSIPDTSSMTRLSDGFVNSRTPVGYFGGPMGRWLFDSLLSPVFLKLLFVAPPIPR